MYQNLAALLDDISHSKCFILFVPEWIFVDAEQSHVSASESFWDFVSIEFCCQKFLRCSQRSRDSKDLEEPQKFGLTKYQRLFNHHFLFGGLFHSGKGHDTFRPLRDRTKTSSVSPKWKLLNSYSPSSLLFASPKFGRNVLLSKNLFLTFCFPPSAQVWCLFNVRQHTPIMANLSAQLKLNFKPGANFIDKF